jgi:pimeloyl-ACP methyl ester carboxylesterase
VTELRPDASDWAGDHAPLAAEWDADREAEPESLVVAMDTGERIHFLDWGGPAQGTSAAPVALPPIVLVHELAQTAWSWAPVARRLSAVTRVVAVDLRGHGLSEAPRTGYDLESLALDVLTVMTANGWGSSVGGRPAVVAGHGALGAGVAATAASIQPQSIAGVALVDGGWEELGAATGMSSTEYVAALAEPPEVLASMEVFLADRRAFDPGTWDADQERAARAQVDQKHAGHVGFVARPFVVRAAVDGLFAYRPEEALAAVSAPLLVTPAASGSADDEEVRERRLALDDVVRARAAAGTGPTRIVTFTGSGHNLMRYRPDELAGELLGLLEVAFARL